MARAWAGSIAHLASSIPWHTAEVSVQHMNALTTLLHPLRASNLDRIVASPACCQSTSEVWDVAGSEEPNPGSSCSTWL